MVLFGGLIAAVICFWLSGKLKQIEKRLPKDPPPQPERRQPKRRQQDGPPYYHDDGTICKA